MPFHVPFNQRASARGNRPGPVYIGFDVPQARQSNQARNRFNWWGFNGMFLSFLSLLTLGFLSPITFLISLIGLRKPGRKMALTGTGVSMLGMALAATIIISAVTQKNQRIYAKRDRAARAAVKAQIIETEKMMVIAGDEFVEYQEQNDGYLPSDIDGNMLVIKYVDPWGESLRFEIEKDWGIIRSAGPDRQFDSKDDIQVKIEGNVEETGPLLPLDE
ncbi:MAG: hypothetical protein AAF623_09215 [Planctomycetota bacterium]